MSKALYGLAGLIVITSVIYAGVGAYTGNGEFGGAAVGAFFMAILVFLGGYMIRND